MADVPPNGGDRLDSWKAIADYLQRDMATARRWEKSLGLPVRRVAGGGRSVFAYKSELDAWLQAEPATHQTPPPSPPRRSPRLVISTALIVVAMSVVAIALWRPWDARDGAVRIDLTAEHIVARDASGAERWRHEFRGDLAAFSNITRNWVIVDGRDPAAYVAVAHTIARADQKGGSGALLEFSPAGRLRRSFSFDDAVAFPAKTYGPPWVMTTLAVDGSTGSRRVAVAGHHYTWYPSPVTVLDEQWRRVGTFVHAGWVEALHWVARDRLLIGGYSESRGGAMVALLDPARLDGQGPEEASSQYYCQNCGSERPLGMLVMPRTEVNRASAWRFNRPLVEKLHDRIIVRTIELEMEGGHADVIYEVSPSLDLISAAYSERYWDAHRMLEAQGKLDHSTAQCPDRNGPRTIQSWAPRAGWRTITLP